VLDAALRKLNCRGKEKKKKETDNEVTQKALRNWLYGTQFDTPMLYAYVRTYVLQPVTNIMQRYSFPEQMTGIGNL